MVVQQGNGSLDKVCLYWIWAKYLCNQKVVSRWKQKSDRHFQTTMEMTHPWNTWKSKQYLYRKVHISTCNKMNSNYHTSTWLKNAIITLPLSDVNHWEVVQAITGPISHPDLTFLCGVCIFCPYMHGLEYFIFKFVLVTCHTITLGCGCVRRRHTL